MTTQVYDDFLIRINFCDPYKLKDVISKVEPEDSETADEETKYGYLNMSRDAEIFDIGHGSGLMGKLLTKEGFTNIRGGDASS